MRVNAASNKSEAYYRLVESYRTLDNKVQHSTIVNIGFLDDNYSAEQQI